MEYHYPNLRKLLVLGLACLSSSAYSQVNTNRRQNIGSPPPQIQQQQAQQYSTRTQTVNPFAFVPSVLQVGTQSLAFKKQFPNFYDIITHNSPKSSVDNHICINGMLCFSGEINFDLRYYDRFGDPLLPGSYIGPGTRPLFGEKVKQVVGSINNADLFTDVALGNWVSAHFDFAYVNASATVHTDAINDGDWGSARRDGAALKVNQVYMLLANPSVTPFFVQMGKMNLNFGDYNPFPMTKSLTQLISEIRTGGMIAGFILPSGFYGSANWSMAQQSLENLTYAGPFLLGTNRDRNYGGKIGFYGDVNCLHINANASYIADMRDADYISSAFFLLNEEHRKFFFTNLILENQYYLYKRTRGVALHADFRYGPVALGGDYVTALNPVNEYSNNSRIRAWGVDGSVSFNIPYFNCPSTLSVGYQGSADSAIFHTAVIGPTNFGEFNPGKILPQRRFIGSYTVKVAPFTAAIEWVNDKDSVSQYGGTDNSSNMGVLRLAAEF